METTNELQHYASPDGWFEVDVPASWTIQPEEAESTTLFFDPLGTGGTLRVTAMAITGPDGEPINMVAVLNEKWNLETLPSGFAASFTDRTGAVQYENQYQEEALALHQRAWEIAQGNVLLAFSYTNEADKWAQEAVQAELTAAAAIVASLKFTR